MAAAKEGVELSVAAPDEAFGAALLALGFELLAEARHQARQVTLALARGAAATGGAVLAKEALAGVIHERVHIRGKLQVLG
jgi:hypothetical protein